MAFQGRYRQALVSRDVILKTILMNAIFKKLNYKQQEVIYILNAPASFTKEMDDLSNETAIKEKLPSSASAEFILAFASRQKELDILIPKIVNAAKGDALIWLAYPKKSSKNYTCDFNRDTGWAALGEAGYEPVRMIAIDEDWSALRFRKAENIKTMKRSSAISEKGKERITSKKAL